MRIVVLSLMVLFTGSAVAQRVNPALAAFKDIQAGSLFLTNVSGVPLTTKKYADVQGSPFFADEWKKAFVVLNKKTVYKDVPVKLNLVENEVHFLDGANNELVAYPGIKEVVFFDSARQTTHHFVHSSLIAQEVGKDRWYLWLFHGPVSAYKLVDKRLEEQQLYGTATVRQRIVTKEKFYITYKDALHEAGKLKDLTAVFPQHKAALEAFHKKLRDDLPQEERLVEMVTYLNTLVKEQ